MSHRIRCGRYTSERFVVSRARAWRRTWPWVLLLVTAGLYGCGVARARTARQAGPPLPVVISTSPNFFTGLEGAIRLEFENQTGLFLDGKASIVISDVSGRRIHAAARAVMLGPREQESMDLSVVLPRYGLYFLKVSVRSDGGASYGLRRTGFGAIPPLTTTGEESPFGLHKASLEEWPPIGARWARLWDTHDTWLHLMPAPDAFHFARLDRQVAAAKRQGINVLLTLGLTPRWASARPDEPSPYGPGHAAPPRAPETWEQFVREVVTRYRDAIRYFEIWNEPESPQFFTGAPREYVQLLQSAARAARAANPRVQIVGPTTLFEDRPEFLEAILREGALSFLDVLSIHTYTIPNPPEALLNTVRSVKALLRQYGGEGKPLWSTEAGQWVAPRVNGRPMTDEEIRARATLPSGGWTERWPYAPVTEETASAYLVRHYVLCLGEGIDKVFWYMWHNPFGLAMADPTDGPFLPALAYAGMVARLEGTRFSLARSADGLWHYEFTGAGTRVSVIWSTKEEQLISIQTEGRAIVYDLYGNPLATHEGSTRLTLTAGPVPIYLEETR